MADPSKQITKMHAVIDMVLISVRRHLTFLDKVYTVLRNMHYILYRIGPKLKPHTGYISTSTTVHAPRLCHKY